MATGCWETVEVAVNKRTDIWAMTIQQYWCTSMRGSGTCAKAEILVVYIQTVRPSEDLAYFPDTKTNQ
jgi:hypothetical protein